MEAQQWEGERLLRMALWMVRGISGRAIATAIEAHGSLEQACALPREELAACMELKAGGRAQLLAAPEDLVAFGRGWMERLLKRGGRAILRGDPAYPDLGTLADPPEVLFCRGELGGAGTREAVAVVGARRADLAAIRQARQMGAALAEAGYTVVSGGALGVDRAAHEGALAAGGKTVAVLGSGVLLPLPASNRRLFSKILAGGGALISELPPTESARAEHFPRRNRLIAGLSRAALVVRAASGSGSLYTARATQAQGRELFVVPAPEAGEAAAGGEALLAEGAQAVRDPDELLAALRGEARRRPEEASSPEGRILAAISLIPGSVAEVASQAKLTQGEAGVLLASLCVKGLAKPAGPGRFIRAS